MQKVRKLRLVETIRFNQNEMVLKYLQADVTLTCDGMDISRARFVLLWQQGSGSLFFVKEGIVQLYRHRGENLKKTKHGNVRIFIKLISLSQSTIMPKIVI